MREQRAHEAMSLGFGALHECFDEGVKDAIAVERLRQLRGR
jgi:hypothetical protein